MSIAKRLESLVENPSLKSNKRDYDFALSLREAYQRQGRLTPGRRPWLDKLEEKYSEQAVAERAALADPQAIERFEILLPKTPESSWNRGFIESVLNQVSNGYRLSARQLEIVAKIEGECSPAAMASRNRFAEEYCNPESGLRSAAMVVSKYYLQNTPYFNDIARLVLNNETFVPTEAQYNKMVKNKYAQKILVGYNSEPKYPTGTLVQLRATAPRHRGAKAVVTVTNYVEPVSACAGNKVYQLLPLGETVPFVVEERHIKTWRAAK